MVVVIAIKKDKELRIFLDLPAVKNAIQREHFPMPHIEDVMQKLQEVRVVSKVDLETVF